MSKKIKKSNFGRRARRARRCEWDVEKWSSNLDEKGMGTAVKRQFFLLAQYDKSGKLEANKLLSKMIDSSFRADNPSAWLHHHVKRARYEIERGP